MSLLKPVGDTATRISLAGSTTTVFGGTGCLGPHLVSKLGYLGNRVVVPYRGDFSTVMRHRVSGVLGQIVPQPYQIWDEDAIRRQLEHSNTVVNLVGSWKNTVNFSVEAANEFTAYRLAKISKEMGVERFIHFSALGAHEDAPARFLRSKARSEDIVRSIYPDATIMRPGPVWDVNCGWMGPFVRRMLKATVIRHPAVHDMWVQCQPVARGDVTDAIIHAMVMQESVGKTYELFSDRIAMEAAYQYLATRIAPPHGNLHEVLRQVPLNSERLLRLTQARSWIDLTLTDRVASGESGVLTLEDLHITPMSTVEILEMLVPRTFRGANAPDTSIFLSEGARKDLEATYNRISLSWSPGR